jgi:hypothetical protein
MFKPSIAKACGVDREKEQASTQHITEPENTLIIVFIRIPVCHCGCISVLASPDVLGRPALANDSDTI